MPWYLSNCFSILLYCHCKDVICISPLPGTAKCFPYMRIPNILINGISVHTTFNGEAQAGITCHNSQPGAGTWACGFPDIHYVTPDTARSQISHIRTMSW